MKYKNNPAEPLEKGEMLQLYNNSGFWADRRRGMLYYVQDFIERCPISATASG
ncbi:hypothetical protein [Paenibacillus sp. FSL E2-0178]|uniref:hypothetical protein n=1 Tax=Paenibacillus sp. FSL E2-0178 TaxID=2921361 RepID=UPI003157F32A